MNFKSVLNDVCCDNRIKNGVIDLKNADHVFVLQEYLENAGFDIETIVNKTAQLFEAGKFPDRQAYNKDGILVTFPNKEYRDRAINKGTHFAENPKKGETNIFTEPPVDIEQKPEEPKGSVPIDTELAKNADDASEDSYEDRTPKEKVVDAHAVDYILTGETPLVNYSVDEAKRYGFYNKGLTWYDTEGNLIGEQIFDEKINKPLIVTNESLLTKVSDILKSTWNKVKSYFKSTVSRLVDNSMADLSPGEETDITIPSSIAKDNTGLENPDSIKTEGALEAIRGNYNEALTVKYVIEKNETPIDVVLTEGLVFKVVQLDANGKRYIPEVETTVNDWDAKLRKAAGSKYEQIRSVISLASNDMASYIINSVGKNKGNILQIFLDNKSFLQGAEFKADIRLKVKKSSGEEVLDAYSLKMYQTKQVNLANTTKNSLVKHLCGEDVAEQFMKELKSDPKFKELNKNASEANLAVAHAKKAKESEDYLEALRGIRERARYPLNQYLAEKVANKLKSFYTSSTENRDKFIKNVLKVMGFEDTETKFLMALVGTKQVKSGKSQIIDKHPSLDLSDIDIVNEPGKVTIKIINKKTNKTLINFTAKEGKNFAGFVDVLS
jgi:hypothetical protein